MIQTILTSILSFVGTNIDDLFLNALFFAQADERHKVRAVTAGKYLGIGVLLAVSYAAASLFAAFPVQYLRLLGLIPFGLGVREWFQSRKTKEKEETLLPDSRGLLVSTAAVTIANGGDNIGVYIPLLAGYTHGQFLVLAVVFGVMTGLWCFLGKRLADMPLLKSFLQKNRHCIVPAVLMVLGLSILLG